MDTAAAIDFCRKYELHEMSFKLFKDRYEVSVSINYIEEEVNEEKDASLNIQTKTAVKEEKKAKKSSAKVSLDDIDKKLDEILEIDIDKV